MSDVISWSANVAISGGPSLSLAGSLVTAAYDVCEFAVPAQDGDPGTETMPVHPGETDEVHLLVLKATRYEAGTLSYAFHPAGTPPDDTTGDTALDGPQLYNSQGMISSSFTDLAEISVTNTSDSAVTVTVVVGRTTPTS